jgi:hypothetical protein
MVLRDILYALNRPPSHGLACAQLFQVDGPPLVEAQSDQPCQPDDTLLVYTGTGLLDAGTEGTTVVLASGGAGGCAIDIELITEVAGCVEGCEGGITIDDGAEDDTGTVVMVVPPPLIPPDPRSPDVSRAAFRGRFLEEDPT